MMIPQMMSLPGLSCVCSRMKGGTFCILSEVQQLSQPCSGEGGGRPKLLCQIWPQLMEEVG